MVNVLSVLLGAALKILRGKTSSADIAKLIDVKDSTYRVYETGKQIIGIELAIPLVRVPGFESINIKQLGQYLMLAKYYEKRKDSTDREALWQHISSIDDEIGKILALDKKRQVEAVLDYLKKQEITLTDTFKIKVYKDALENAIEKVPCILHSLVSSYYKELEGNLDMLAQVNNDINSIGSKIKDLTSKINSIMKLNISFNSKNAPDFVKELNLEEVYGIVSNPAYLTRKEIIESYKSYMLQVWKDDFKQINFLFLSDKTSEIDSVVQEYRNTLMRKLYKDNIDKSESHFQKGIKRINFRYISKNHPELQKMLAGNSEFWYYKTVDAAKNDVKIYPIEYGFITYELDDAYQYRILTIGEVTQYKTHFIDLWESHAKSRF